jgi:hypothetical protein
VYYFFLKTIHYYYIREIIKYIHKMLTIRGTHKGALVPAAKYAENDVAAYAGLGKELYESRKELDALRNPLGYLEKKHEALEKLREKANTLFIEAQRSVCRAVRGTEDIEDMEPWELEKAAQIAAAKLVAEKEAIEVQFPGAEARRAENIASMGRPGKGGGNYLTTPAGKGKTPVAPMTGISQGTQSDE